MRESVFSARLDSAHVSSARLNSMCLRQWEQRQRDVEREKTLRVNTTCAAVIHFSRLSKKCRVWRCTFVKDLDFVRRKRVYIKRQTGLWLQEKS